MSFPSATCSLSSRRAAQQLLRPAAAFPAPYAARSVWSSSSKQPRSAAVASASPAGQPSRSASSSSSSSSSSSVHASEIAHFTRLASQWWDPHGEFALLHAMNPVRIEFMRAKMDEVRTWDAAVRAAELRRQHREGAADKGKGRAVYEDAEPARASFLHGLDVLDVGCGGGFLSESLTRLGARTLGIDAASSNIQIARAHASLDPALTSPTASTSLQYRDCTAEVLLDEGAQFDVVCAMEVVEHVRNPADFLRTLDGLLKPGGHLFMSTISRTAFAHFLTITMAERVLRLVSPGTHTYEQYIKPHELLDFVRRSKDRGGLGWYAQGQEGPTGAAVPERLRYEVRGTAYLPWKSAWQLADRNASPSWSQLANYFFWARKPLDA